MTGEIGHQPREFVIRAPGDQRQRVRVAHEILIQPLAPGGAAAEHQRRVKLVRAVVDPVRQTLAAGFCKGISQQRTMFQNDDIPAETLKQRCKPRPQTFAHHRIETLAVVIDNPPAIAQTLFPALEQGFKDIAFVEFGITDERDHPPFAPAEPPAMRAHIILGKR